MSLKRRGLSLAALAIGAAFLVASCGGKAPSTQEVASLGDTPSPTASAEGDTDGKGSGLEYAQCMRENGVKEFPDPTEDGKLTIKAKPGSGMDPNSPTWKKAEEACKSLRPEPSEGQKQEMRAQALKYSQCMRENGIEEFPDPNPDGGMMLRMKKGSDLDPESPKFQAAQEACKSLMPGGKGGPGGATDGESK